MAANRRWKSVLVYVGVLAAAGLLGTLAGTGWGNWKADAARQEDERTLTEYFEQNLIGIEIGQPFPPIPVWTPDGSQAAIITDLLPEGGLVVVLSASCPTCIETVVKLNQTVLRSNGNHRQVLLIAEGDPTELVAGMAERGIDLPLYHDTPEALAREHHLLAYPAVFSLDAEGRVLSMFAGGQAKERLPELIKP